MYARWPMYTWWIYGQYEKCSFEQSQWLLHLVDSDLSLCCAAEVSKAFCAGELTPILHIALSVHNQTEAT